MGNIFRETTLPSALTQTPGLKGDGTQHKDIGIAKKR